jgi:hypothetical protein
VLEDDASKRDDSETNGGWDRNGLCRLGRRRLYLHYTQERGCNVAMSFAENLRKDATT